jgi:hypothetical protein
MSKSWDSRGIAFDPETWRAALRILKPGGHLLAFGGTRTFHRLTCAIEDAGFEIRDCLMWLYGSGFPKSHNVGKAMNDGRHPHPGDFRRREARAWEGYGTALKPAWEPIILARKPLVGTVAANVLEYGAGALNIDECRIATTDRWEASGARSGESVALSGGVDGSLNISVSATHPSGRWPANAVLSHSEGCVRLGERRVRAAMGTSKGDSDGHGIYGTKFPRGDGREIGYADEDGLETVELWACVPGCPVRMLDDQSGEIGNKWKKNYGELYAKKGIQYKGGSFGGGGYVGGSIYSDRGGASRFFYCPKASTKERNLGLEDFDANIVSDGDETPKKNIHTTVKPLKLMRWLVRLVTPLDSIILDPFNGSGTTGIAAILEGFNFIGIDMEAEYCKIAEARLAYWSKQLGKDDG